MVTQSRTRENIRVAVGYNVKGLFYVSAASSSGSTTTLVDNTLVGGDDNFNGYWVVFTSGDNDGSIRRVTDYVESTKVLTVGGDAVTATANNDTYELWHPWCDPSKIHDAINQTIDNVTARAYQPDEDTSIHMLPGILGYALPSNIAGVTRLEQRVSYSGKTVHYCDRAFDESVDSDFTVTTDTQDSRTGTSVKFTVGGSVSAGDIASDSITSLNLAKYDYLEFWAKATTATAAADLRLRLSATANGGTETEALDIPALTARTWTYVRVALGNPEIDTAIISVALEYNANAGANTVWLDDIKAVADYSAQWEGIDPITWRLDRESRRVVFFYKPRYRLLRVKGLDKPVQLNADATVSEVDPDYVVAKTTELVLGMNSGGPQTDSEDRRRLMAYWGQVAQRRSSTFPVLQGVRLAE